MLCECDSFFSSSQFCTCLPVFTTRKLRDFMSAVFQKSSKGTYYIYSFIILEFEEMTKLKLYTNHVQTVATTPVKLQKSISKKTIRGVTDTK